MADQKLTQLTETTSANAGDILYLVGDTGGTPVSLKVSKKNLLKEYASTGGNYITFAADAGLSVDKVLMSGTNATVRTDGTAIYIDATTNATAATIYFAPTGAPYITYAADSTLGSELILKSGSSVTLTSDATSIYVNAITNAAGGVIYAPTGGAYVTFVADAGLSGEKILSAGTNVVIATDATTIWISANSGAATGSIYAPTGGRYVAYAADGDLTAELILTAGSSITTRTDATNFYIDATTANILAFVTTDRTLTAVFPVTGGGTLAANRTFWVDTAFLVNTGSTIWNSRVSTDTTIVVIYPLTGGGTMSTSRTIRIDTAFLTNTGSLYFAGSGLGFITWKAEANLNAEKVLANGSNTTIRTDATSVYVDSSFTPPVIYAPTGGSYITWGADANLSAELILKSGSSVTLTSDATSVYVNATTNAGSVMTNVESGGTTALAFYRNASTLSGSTITMTTGTGIAAWNVPLLVADPAGSSNGDIWFLSTGGGVYLRVNTNSTIKTLTFS